MQLDQDRVPISFDEALSVLDAGLTQEEKEAWSSMTAARLFELQSTLARTLMNDWSLEDSSTPLRLFFRELGLDDPEEVSLLLIDASWRSHHKESISLHDLVCEYLDE
jgi:hypothetical protein